jgi:hypothetical protein
VVGTATETTDAGAAMTAAGMPMTALGMLTTAPGAGADGIAFATAVGAAKTTAWAATSAATAAKSAWRFERGVAHMVQYLPPLLKEVHAPHSQSEAEEEEAMMGGLWLLVVMVVWGLCGV